MVPEYAIKHRKPGTTFEEPFGFFSSFTLSGFTIPKPPFLSF
jgi:hypothetical protein